LEDTLKAFLQSNAQVMQEIKNATMVNSQFIHQIKDAAMVNTEAIERLEGQLSHLIAKFNRIEEEEFQTQEMARGQYMIDEGGPSNPHHEHVQATTFGSEEIVKETIDEPSLEDHLEACLAQFGDDLDLDKLFEQADAILDPSPEMRPENGEEENEEQIELPPIPIFSNDKEVITEAHSFVTIPLETYLEPQVSSLQCLEEPSYVEIFKESHTEDQKSRNRVPNWIPRNKVNYIRWWNILPEGYLIFKKKGWKGLVGHLYERGRCGFFFLFYFLHCIFDLFSVNLFYFIFLFLTAINLLMFDF
jgi:hypothetical protein